MRRHFRWNYKIELCALCPYLCFQCHLQLFSRFLSQVNMQVMICRRVGRSKLGSFPCYCSVILLFFLISYQLSDLVSYVAVVCLVTQRSSPRGEERCVTRQRTAAQETTQRPGCDRSCNLYLSIRQLSKQDSVFYFVHSFSIFAFLFILVQLVDVGSFSMYVSALGKQTLT